MAKIELVAWDIYGTIISTAYNAKNNPNPNLRVARPGALEALSQIKSRGIYQCTCSDGNPIILKDNLEEIGIKKWGEFFEDLYQMLPCQQKDFSYIIEEEFGIRPENLLVIGDNYEIDIKLAKQQGCQTLWVPEKHKSKPNPLDVNKIMKLISYVATFKNPNSL